MFRGGRGAEEALLSAASSRSATLRNETRTAASCSEGNPAGSPLPETHSLFEADRRGRPETPGSARCSNPSIAHNPKAEPDKALIPRVPVSGFRKTPAMTRAVADGQSCNRYAEKKSRREDPAGVGPEKDWRDCFGVEREEGRRQPLLNQSALVETNSG